MTSNLPAPRTSAPRPVPRTAVPLGLQDPVEKARAELKAALAAIEDKSNLPKRVNRATERFTGTARAFAKDQPVLAVAAAVGVALAVGAAVWGAIRLYIR